MAKESFARRVAALKKRKGSAIMSGWRAHQKAIFSEQSYLLTRFAKSRFDAKKSKFDRLLRTASEMIEAVIQKDAKFCSYLESLLRSSMNHLILHQESRGSYKVIVDSGEAFVRHWRLVLSLMGHPDPKCGILELAFMADGPLGFQRLRIDDAPEDIQLAMEQTLMELGNKRYNPGDLYAFFLQRWPPE